MAKKPHKFAWNGVDIDTALSASDLASICAQAAIESTGDLWKGKQRIDKTDEGDGWIVYVIKNALITWSKLLSFSVDIEAGESRRRLGTTIHTYTTTQPTVGGFIPVAATTMVAHHTYMQFAHKVANTVRAADPSARIVIREGVEVPGALTALPSFEAAPVTVPATAPSTVPSGEPRAEPTPTGEAIFVEPTAAPAPVLQAPPPPPPPPPTARHLPALPPIPVVPSAPRTPWAPPVSALAPAPPAPPTVKTVKTVNTPAVSIREIDDSTRKVPRRQPASGGWELVSPDGAILKFENRILVGRDPESIDGGAAQLFTVPDSERLVSKTHAMFSLVGGQPHVTDLHSANGSFVLAPDGNETQCEPDVPTLLRDGWEVELGAYPVGVRTSGGNR